MVCHIQGQPNGSLRLVRKIDAFDDEPPSSEENGHEFYEVEKIIDVHLHRKYHSQEYKVQFKGYGPDDDMWLPRSSFQELVQFQKFGRIPPKMTLKAH